LKRTADRGQSWAVDRGRPARESGRVKRPDGPEHRARLQVADDADGRERGAPTHIEPAAPHLLQRTRARSARCARYHSARCARCRSARFARCRSARCARCRSTRCARSRLAGTRATAVSTGTWAGHRHSHPPAHAAALDAVLAPANLVLKTKHSGRPRHILKGPTHLPDGDSFTKHTGRPRHLGHTSSSGRSDQTHRTTKTHPEGADTPPEGDSSGGRSDQTHGTTKTPPEGADTHRTRSPNTWDDQDTSATPPQAVYQTHGTTKTHRPYLGQDTS